MKIVLLDGYTLNPGDIRWDGFSKLGDFVAYDRTPKELTVKRIGDAEIVLTNNTPVTEEVLNQCPQIRYIGVLSTGYNSVDVDAAHARGVVVTNIPAYGSAPVAQFAIALLLEICCRVCVHNEAVHNGVWTAAPDFCFWLEPLIALSGKTMGIVGLGRIGMDVAKIARALEMDVVAYDEYPSDTGRALAHYVCLEELLAVSDVVSLHCPLTDATRGMICAKTIAKMKNGVILINNGRGALLNEADVADALNSGKIYYAGLDVASKEPIEADNPLLKARHCIITPHISWAARETRERLLRMGVQNLERFLQGDPINTV